MLADDDGRRRRHRGEAAKYEDRDATPDLLFETSRCNICNIRLKANETFETCI